LPNIRELRVVSLNYTRPSRISSPLRKRIFDRDGRVCVYCGSCENLSVDHILPKSLGGGDEEENLVTSCTLCNSMKGAKSAATIIELWAQRRLGENPRG
jgi:5-methylcytosine-specific restriction endonuclease McrA